MKHMFESGGQKERTSNLEVFRIIVMLLIVAHHYVVNSGLTAKGGPIYSEPLAWRSIFLLLFGAWGKIGINCFVMITGYFMCTSHITVRKFIKLLGEVMFYRIVIYLIFLGFGYEMFSWIGFIEVFIPITSLSTNFISAFLVFYLTIPFLNILIKHMTEKQHIRLMLLCFFIYIFLGTFHKVTMNYVSWFIVIYFIGSYIRFYPKKIFDNTKLWGGLSVISVLVSGVSVIVCAWYSMKIGKDMAYYLVTDSNTFLAVATGVCSFLFFKNANIENSRLINSVAASTYGVLLIHANSDTMRRWLWEDTLNNVEMYNSAYMPLHAVGSVICIFIICNLIDHIRISFIEKPFLKWWDKIWLALKTKRNKNDE